jgi:hypothetical protein
VPVDLVALVADLIPKPAVSAYVADWPQDEQDYYRDHRGSFTDCNRELDRMRQEKAARAILAALKIDLGQPDDSDHDGDTPKPTAGRSWYFYGPTDSDPDPGKMWCYDCGCEVWALGDGLTCRGCDNEEDADA